MFKHMQKANTVIVMIPQEKNVKCYYELNFIINLLYPNPESNHKIISHTTGLTS